MQSTGDLVIMNQYICIMQNWALCLAKRAQHIHSSQFRLLWNTGGEAILAVASRVPVPKGSSRVKSRCELVTFGVYHKTAFAEGAGSFPVNREQVINFAFNSSLKWKEAEFLDDLQMGSVSPAGLFVWPCVNREADVQTTRQKATVDSELCFGLRVSSRQPTGTQLQLIKCTTQILLRPYVCWVGVCVWSVQAEKATDERQTACHIC